MSENNYPKLTLKNGERVPGATSIVKLLDKSYLVKWANKLGLQGIEVNQYVEKTARVGKIIHSIIESHLTKIEVDLDAYNEEEIAKAESVFYKKYLEWENQHTIEPIFLEKILISENHRYGGILDCYCLLDGKYTLIDFKTSKSISPEYIVQLASYKELLEENSYQVDRVMILNLPKDTDDSFMECVIEDNETINYYFTIFKKLLDIYYLKKQLGWT